MELLVIKNGSDYIRSKAGTFITVGLDKASVFPQDRQAHARQLLADARATGFPDAALYKLTVVETPL